MPEGVIRDGGNAGVKLHALQRLSVYGADGLGELLDVVIRVRVAESVAGVVEEILSVDEGDRAFDGGLGWHHAPQKNNPTEALRRVSRVRSDLSIGQLRLEIKQNSLRPVSLTK
jgi:hypothetical protein